MNSVAGDFYADLIEGFELGERLSKELDFEQDYLDHVIDVVDHFDPSGELSPSYRTPFGHAGGRDLQVVFDSLLKLVMTSEGPTSRVYCGIWPSGELGARTRRQGVASIITIDIGLWFYLRFACQQVAQGLSAITESVDTWGPDKPESGDVLRQYLDRYITGGSTLRENTNLHVMVGARESFRRDLNTSALAYIIGHEFSHAISSDEALSTVVWSEEGELKSQALEQSADSLAARVLSKEPFVRNPLAAVMGPMLVLHLQGFALRTQQDQGLDPENWTHLLPELRSAMMQEALGQRNPTLSATAERFRQWLWAAFDYDALFKRAVGKAT